jgi:N-glycosylase/DNA lyase
MPSIVVKNLNLQYTIESGQIFRWIYRDGWYYIGVGNRLLKIKQEGKKLIYYGKKINRAFLSSFFRLDDNYDDILSEINKDIFINEAIKKYYGLRILRQDPWECLVSFVCSSVSNIPKIKKNLFLISSMSGQQIQLDDYTNYNFPSAENLGNLKKLKLTKIGFRANYIQQLSKIVEKDYFQKLRDKSYGDAKSELVKLPGVGEKIADCVLLFSMNRLEAFPVDVWIKRVMEDTYFNKRKSTNKKILQFAQSYFGEYAGYAQQFLYHYKRTSSRYLIQ